MNNKEFIGELSKRLGYTVKDTQKMVVNVVDAMVESLQEGNTVGVQNFGQFELKKKMERIMVNPTTGQRMLVPPKLVVGFRASSAWKNLLKNGGEE
jgi:DNA-binding protein HU-beta/integration host factor subunit alpha